MDTYTVEFRIEGPALIPSDVTTALGLQPCIIADDVTNNSSKRSRDPFWSYDGISTESDFVEQEWKSLEEGLSFLLDKLLPKRDLIRARFGEFKTYLWCGRFQESFDGGPIFSPDLLRKLAEFGVALMISSYKSQSD